MIKIAVSACLLGHNVRYDGQNKQSTILNHFDSRKYQLVALCPEVEMGLAVPRPPIQIRNNKTIQLVQVQQPQLDYTSQMQHWFERNIAVFNSYHGFVLKSKSPSCGNQTTPHYFNDGTSTLSDGLFVHLLKQHKPMVPLLDEQSMTNPITLKRFKQALLTSL